MIPPTVPTLSLGAINDGIDHPTGAAMDSPVIEIVIHNNAAGMLFACATPKIPKPSSIGTFAVCSKFWCAKT